MKKTFLLLLIFSFFSLHANIINSPVPGGIKKLSITSNKPPIVYFKNHRVAIKQNGDKFEAIIGIPLDEKETKQAVRQTFPDDASYQFTIQDKQYRTQRLTIKNKRKVTPNPLDEKRIKQEDSDFNKTIAVWRNAKPFKKPFIAPVKGYITSTFGLRRFYNDKPRAPHTALDIAAPKGKPIHATAAGQVINIHHRFFTGNTVIIDHGQGVMSLYAHLSEFNVKNGQYVKQGDVIGKVGKTGRVTGAHLHWAMYLNQTTVDPLLFVPRKKIIPSPKKKDA
jgi:murein DD-endopeptidase MepM/ murein hydrolase activator NlpD